LGLGNSTCDNLIDKHFIRKYKSTKGLDTIFQLGVSLLDLKQSMVDQDSVRIDSEIGALHE